MKHIAARETVGLLRTMTRVLCTVAVLALIFTTVNVTRFATSHDVPLPVALLLDPMIGTALAGVLYVDARLASWGIRPPTWSTALRWSAGCTAALMNTWESLWPEGQIGWPRHADPAAVLLHLTPALLLIALTETIAAYRRRITELLDQIKPADPPEPPTQAAPTTPSSFQGHTDPAAPTHDPSDPSPVPKEPEPDPRPAENGTIDPTLWQRAVALDNASRSANGDPVSIWRLRTDLHIGPKRARQIHTRLLQHPADPPPRPNTDRPQRPTDPPAPTRHADQPGNP